MSDQHPSEHIQPPASMTSGLPSADSFAGQGLPSAPLNTDSGPPPSKTRAILALVLAFIPTPITLIASLILAILVISDSRDGRAHGKGMAIAALGVLAAWLVAGVAILAVVLAGEAERDDQGNLTDSGSISVTALKAGDCLAELPVTDGTVTFRINVLPCSDPHLVEAYADFNLDLDDLPASPSQDDLVKLADDGCYERFKGFVGISPLKSELEVLYYYPILDSLDVDRGVVCLIETRDATEGSLKGSKR